MASQNIRSVKLIDRTVNNILERTRKKAAMNCYRYAYCVDDCLEDLKDMTKQLSKGVRLCYQHSNTASPRHKTEASRLVTQTTETIQIPQDDAYVTVCSLFNIHDYFSPSHLALKPLELNLYPLNVPSASSNSTSVPTPQLHTQGCSINHCRKAAEIVNTYFHYASVTELVKQAIKIT